MPLQRSAQPAADGERLRPMQQIFLRNLGAEAGEGAEDLQSAAHHHEERDGVDPVAQAHDEWMLIYGAGHDHRRFFFAVGVLTLGLDDFNYCTAHFLTSRSVAPLSSAAVVAAFRWHVRRARFLATCRRPANLQPL